MSRRTVRWGLGVAVGDDLDDGGRFRCKMGEVAFSGV